MTALKAQSVQREAQEANSVKIAAQDFAKTRNIYLQTTLLFIFCATWFSF